MFQCQSHSSRLLCPPSSVRKQAHRFPVKQQVVPLPGCSTMLPFLQTAEVLGLTPSQSLYWCHKLGLSLVPPSSKELGRHGNSWWN